jgi:Ca2+/Na+ antiporter
MKPMIKALTGFFKSLYNDPTYQVGAIFLILVVLVLLIYLRSPKFKDQRANFVLGIVIVGLLLMIMALPPSDRWQWIVGLLPTLMVGYQLFFLWFNHPKEIDTGSAGGVDRAGQPPQLKEQSYERAKDTINSHFSLKTLFARYGLPAVLLGITGIVVSSILIDPNGYFSLYVNTLKVNQPAAERILLGLRLGAVGAYVYILLELGRRTFRHDVTGASAMWCWVTLVLGPVLAATVAFLWHIEAATGGTGWWGSGIVLFFTGFAPRRVIAAIEQAASELLKAGPSATVQSRVIPLSQIRGIDAQIEQRLDEEGVYDVNTLAAAEPVRLVRNTPFDMRQILTWIDEAILVVTLPRSWQALEEEGITGAIDLAWYYDKIVDPETRQIKDPLPPSVKTLADKSKLDPTSLVTTIQRLSENTQVQYIWALYNNFTEYSSGDKDSASQNGNQQGKAQDGKDSGNKDTAKQEPIPTDPDKKTLVDNSGGQGSGTDSGGNAPPVGGSSS